MIVWKLWAYSMDGKRRKEEYTGVKAEKLGKLKYVGFIQYEKTKKLCDWNVSVCAWRSVDSCSLFPTCLGLKCGNCWKSHELHLSFFFSKNRVQKKFHLPNLWTPFFFASFPSLCTCPDIFLHFTSLSLLCPNTSLYFVAT